MAVREALMAVLESLSDPEHLCNHHTKQAAVRNFAKKVEDVEKFAECIPGGFRHGRPSKDLEVVFVDCSAGNQGVER